VSKKAITLACARKKRRKASRSSWWLMPVSAMASVLSASTSCGR
jgi:hypothetical protein